MSLAEEIAEEADQEHDETHDRYEQIKQGEKLAERLRQATSKPGAIPGVDVGTLIERALNVYKDMGSLAMAAMETLVRSPVLQSTVAKAWAGGADASA